MPNREEGKKPNSIWAALKSWHPHATDLAQLRDRLRREPDDALAHYALAGIYAKLNMPSEAISTLRSCLAVRPDYAPAYNNLGNA